MRIHVIISGFISLNTLQETIVSVWKAIMLLTKDLCHGVANQIKFGLNVEVNKSQIILWKEKYYVSATLVYWVKISWNNVLLIFIQYKRNYLWKPLILCLNSYIRGHHLLSAFESKRILQKTNFHAGRENLCSTRQFLCHMYSFV